jgi:hypothetical protein
MKNLKHILLVLIAGLIIAPSSVNAQPMKKGPAQKIASHRVLVKTAFVIHHAYKLVKENKVYTGNLARAINHQKYARMLYREGKYARAMHQSRRARYFALLAIKANKGQETADMNYSKEDNAAMGKNAPSDDELDKEMNAAMSKEPTKDEDFMNADPDVDIRDNE